MKFLETKIPPPVVTALFGLAMWWISTVTSTFEINLVVQIIAIVIVLGTGFYFAFSAFRTFKRVQTTVDPIQPEKATSLVSSGVFQRSRNPMYVGLALLLTTWTIFLSAPVALVGVLGFMLYMNKFQSKPEERALEQIFGSEFEDYKSSVRQWL